MAKDVWTRSGRGVAMLAALAAVAACHRSAAGAATPDGAARGAATRPNVASVDGRGGQSVSDTAWSGQHVERAEDLMRGRFPGVHVTEVPGQGIVVRVRGVSTFTGNTAPLYVVDGFPISPGQGGLLPVSPKDIARIQVLKDPAETAEYGVRGGNGVILITTKR